MTTDQVIAFATPIAVIVAAVIQQLDARRAKKDRDVVKDKVAEVAEKVATDTTKLDAIAVKADHITELTNGHLSKVTEELKVANDKIAGLEKLVSAALLNKNSGGEGKGRALPEHP